MKTGWTLGLCTLIAFATAVYGWIVLPTLPEMVPTHWNLAGHVDGWTERSQVVWMMPVFILVLSIILLALPMFGKGSYPKRFNEVYNPFVVVIACFMAFVQGVILSTAWMPAESDVPARWIVAGVFVLFALIGNQMGRLQPNPWAGIRVYWTFTSEKVWNETHRWSAWVWTLSSVGGVLLLALGAPMWVALLVLVPLCLAPIFIAYKCWVREGKPEMPNQNRH